MHFAGIIVVLTLLSGFAFVAFQLLSGPLSSFVQRCCAFLGGVIDDCLRATGAAVACVLFLASACWSIVVGRWAATGHYFRAAKSELGTALRLIYRASLRRPLELVWLGPMVRQFEDSVGNVIARAPGRDYRRGKDEFPGYRVLEALPSGGSGARLWLAEPLKPKAGRHENPEIARAQRSRPDRVVIKAFSLEEGTELPQMLRENRALEAARRMGHVIEHATDGRRFYYVMPFVPGEDLRTRTLVLHERAERDGLDPEGARIALGYVRDLLEDLERFHAAGLWHKDVKPENILVDHGRARLVDLGLVTPLASGMTLTTHGTEYYRDPELVREALKGAKVHEVDGVRFDLYGAGAVLYSLFESSFPAHGVLSRFAKRCPDAVAWIVRRAMADMHHRYRTAREMRADVDAVLTATDPFALKPAQLPSWRGEDAVELASAPIGTAPAAPLQALPTLPAAAIQERAPRRIERDDASAPARPRRGRSWLVMALILLLGMGFLALFVTPGRTVRMDGGPSSIASAESSLGWRQQSSQTPKGGTVQITSFRGTGSSLQVDGGPLLLIDLRGGRAREEGDALIAELAAEGIKLHGIGGPPQDKELSNLYSQAKAEYVEHLQGYDRTLGFGRLLQRRASRGLDGFVFLRASLAGGDEQLEIFAALRDGVSPLADLLSYLPVRIAERGR
ncbi:MAG: hypothetical protein IPN34_00440 [Planctomycetes bacterium]|nr:hypothetical protein [Planctomycetota bacterium]